MEVIDLRHEICPINLVKFKYHFYRLQNLHNFEKSSFLIKNGEPLNGVIRFLEYKKVTFNLQDKDDFVVLNIKN
jgi:hypothetical protein